MSEKASSWSVVKTNNTPQNTFFRHSSCVDEANSRVFVFGGEDDNNMFMKGAYLLDLLTMTWNDLTMRLETPLQIDSHCCVMYNKSFFVYGGNDSTTDFDSVTVYRIKVSPYGIEIETIFEETKNSDLPDPRREHTCVFMESEEHGPEMIVYGGRSRTIPKKVLGDCWAFSLKTLEWRLIMNQDNSNKFPPRCCHASTFDAANKTMYIFGGRNEKHLYCDDLISVCFKGPKMGRFETLKCRLASNMGKRELCGLNLFNNKLYVSCGWCFGQSKNDVWVLDLGVKKSNSNNGEEIEGEGKFQGEEMYEWKLLEEKVGKEKRRGHCSFVYDGKLFVLGGKALRNTNDLMSVELIRENV